MILDYPAGTTVEEFTRRFTVHRASSSRGGRVGTRCTLLWRLEKVTSSPEITPIKRDSHDGSDSRLRERGICTHIFRTQPARFFTMSFGLNFSFEISMK